MKRTQPVHFNGGVMFVLSTGTGSAYCLHHRRANHRRRSRLCQKSRSIILCLCDLTTSFLILDPRPFPSIHQAFILFYSRFILFYFRLFYFITVKIIFSRLKLILILDLNFADLEYRSSFIDCRKTFDKV